MEFSLAVPDREAMIVADTDVASFLFKLDTRAELYRPHLQGRRPVISAQTLAELYRWPEMRGWGEGRRQAFEDYARTFPVVYPDEALCRIRSRITARALRMGRTLPTADAWQAATALYLEAPLVTHNPRNRSGVPGLVILTEAP